MEPHSRMFQVLMSAARSFSKRAASRITAARWSNGVAAQAARAALALVAARFTSAALAMAVFYRGRPVAGSPTDCQPPTGPGQPVLKILACPTAGVLAPMFCPPLWVLAW